MMLTCAIQTPPPLQNEENSWGMSLENLDRAYTEATNSGIEVRAMAVINPGNPTGQCLDRKDMEDVIRFCAEKNIVLLADEVYQANTYNSNRPFFSFKSVLRSISECSDVSWMLCYRVYSYLTSFHAKKRKE